MPHFVRVIDEHRRELWNIDENVATRVGVTNPPTFEAKSGTIWECLEGNLGEGSTSAFRQLVLEPGYYHRRIVRTTSNPDAQSWTEHPQIPDADDRFYAAMARGQLETLVGQLFRICRTIHPIETNFGTYGHDIRNLLILACTEVEMHLKGVLLVNGVSRGSMNIEKYASVSGPLRLREYEVAFPAYPWLSAFRPFAEFGVGDEFSHTLDWYQAYNAVKHNREHEFQRATLGNIFNAVAACAILLVAQFGWVRGMEKGSELSRRFHFVRAPKFEPHEWYYRPLDDEHGDLCQAKNFDFQI